MVEFKEWYVWVTSHREAAKFLLSHFTHDLVAVDVGRADIRVKLTLDMLPHSADSAKFWIKQKLTREMCARILNKRFGFCYTDTRTRNGEGQLEIHDLQKMMRYTFTGPNRWEKALQWALEKWEKEQ